jgi:stage V sporulation protein G
MMRITKITIRPVEMNKVKALASITIDDEFVVHDLRVVEGERGFFVAMPSRKLPNGSHRDIAHPVNTETREHIQTEVLEEYQRQDLAGFEEQLDTAPSSLL